MSLSLRVRGTVLTAATALSLLGGVGIASATPHSPPAPNSAGLDAGMPRDGLHPDVTVTAPDGTRIWRTREGAAPNSVARAFASMPNTVEVNVAGARIRSWVPSGPVLGLAYRGQTGGASCQIPNSGYNWGWVSIGGHTGWMRTDLFTIIYQSTGHWGSLPWC